jgi:hypothetical protein
MTTMNKYLAPVYGAWVLYGGFRHTNEIKFQEEKYKKQAMKRLEFYKSLKLSDYSSEIEEINKEIDKYNKHWLLVDSVGTYLLGSMLHMNPWSVFYIPNELYRLEVNLRGLEEEKKTNRYNTMGFKSLFARD